MGKGVNGLGRRDLLAGAAGLGAATMAGTPAAAVAQAGWDHEADVVVVGTGAAGLSAAVTATAEGARVILVEAQPQMGGTTVRSGGGCWIPNNRYMRSIGLADPREDALRYMARYSFPERFNPADPHLGLSPNDYTLIATYYDQAAVAMERLEALGALNMRGENAYDYWPDAPANKAPYGRTMFPAQPGTAQNDGKIHPATAVTPEWRELNVQLAGGISGGGGPLMISQFGAWIAKNNVPLLLSHRAERILTNAKGEVIGLQAKSAEGRSVRIRARKAVHFGSGGFTSNPALRARHLRGPAFGGCAVSTSQGDLIAMASELGADLGNMQNGWNISLILDEVMAKVPDLHSIWHIGGDSMFLVNRTGRRVVNEKENYGDRNELFADYDPARREWRNMVMFIVFDDRVRQLCAGLYPYAPLSETVSYILSGNTIAALSQRIKQHLVHHAAGIGGYSLADDFADNLEATMATFNRYAESGVDEDFGRGKSSYDLQWHLRALGQKLVPTNDKPNKTMYPLNVKGPYYAVPIVWGHADTNGGPVINAKGQMLKRDGSPIPGLYGAGNCIASPSGRAYWGGGCTLGLAVTFGHLAGLNAAREPVKAA